mmetsp:Transcript_29127/g.96734  ORF Transcript_29127/g.96734 Transcript_29127/m.96734 type:complete len:284 (+) Transcript_29127:169-1020(+)
MLLRRPHSRAARETLPGRRLLRGSTVSWRRREDLLHTGRPLELCDLTIELVVSPLQRAILGDTAAESGQRLTAATVPVEVRGVGGARDCWHDGRLNHMDRLEVKVSEEGLPPQCLRVDSGVLGANDLQEHALGVRRHESKGLGLLQPLAEDSCMVSHLLGDGTHHLQALVVACVEGHAAIEAFEGHHAERPDVPWGAGLPGEGLRRHVLRRPDLAVELGAPRGTGLVDPGCVLLGHVQLAEPEIQQLEVPVLGQDDVVWFDVAVDEAVLVDDIERFKQLGHVE